MKFVRGFRNDTSVNVIKRSPPLPFVRVFKNSLQAEINYTKIFELGEHFSQSSEERGGAPRIWSIPRCFQIYYGQRK